MKSKCVVQLYDGITVPPANVNTSTSNVSPTVKEGITALFRSVVDVRRGVLAAESQLIDAETPVPEITPARSESQR